jgi:hypothetical protein
MEEVCASNWGLMRIVASAELAIAHVKEQNMVFLILFPFVTLYSLKLKPDSFTLSVP